MSSQFKLLKRHRYEYRLLCSSFRLYGGQPNTKNEYGETLLHLLFNILEGKSREIRNIRVSLCSSLMKKGWRGDVEDEMGNTPFCECCDRRWWEEANQMLDFPLSTQVKISGLYVSLACYDNTAACNYFILRLIHSLEYISLKNAPCFLKNIIIGGAFPYLYSALCIGFLRDDDSKAHKTIDYVWGYWNHNIPWLNFLEKIQKYQNISLSTNFLRVCQGKLYVCPESYEFLNFYMPRKIKKSYKRKKLSEKQWGRIFRNMNIN